MWLSIVLASLITASSVLKAPDVDAHFRKFIADYHKLYTDQEYLDRRAIFADNLLRIIEHNMKEGVTFTLSVNEFADLTQAEFASKMGLRRVNGRPIKGDRVLAFDSSITVPADVDWISKGAVGPVQDQGQCGSCWAFSLIGAVEGQCAVKSGKLLKFSEQQLVDCSTSWGNAGCNGGLMDSGFQYIIDKGGVCLLKDYPYTAKDDKCKEKNCKGQIKLTGFVDVTASDESALKQGCAVGPVSVAIQADEFGFQFYKSGIFSAKCGTGLNHGVLLVAYGTDKQSGQMFWKIRNSWGEGWGESGYMRMIRHEGHNNGQCGIAMMASYPECA